MPSLSHPLDSLWEVYKHTSQSSFALRCVFAHFSKRIQWVGEWGHMPSRAKKTLPSVGLHSSYLYIRLMDHNKNVEYLIELALLGVIRESWILLEKRRYVLWWWVLQNIRCTFIIYVEINKDRKFVEMTMKLSSNYVTAIGYWIVYIEMTMKLSSNHVTGIAIENTFRET